MIGKEVSHLAKKNEKTNLNILQVLQDLQMFGCWKMTNGN